MILDSFHRSDFERALILNVFCRSAATALILNAFRRSEFEIALILNALRRSEFEIALILNAFVGLNLK